MQTMREVMDLVGKAECAYEEQVEEPVTPPDTLLEEELLSVSNDMIVEMANLPASTTGVQGVIFISTAMASHGPRVKYSERAGKSQPSFSVSISNQPEVKANSLPQPVLRRMAPLVQRWVSLNSAELLRFWNQGDTWMKDEVDLFIARLKSI